MFPLLMLNLEPNEFIKINFHIFNYYHRNFFKRNFVKLMNKNDPFIKYLNFTFFYIALLKKYFSFFKSRKNLVCYNMRIMKLIWKKSSIKSTCSM